MKANGKTTPLSASVNALWNSAGCFFYLGCQWLTTVLVVVLSATYDNSGILAFCMATGVIFSAIGPYGIRTYQVSDLNEEYSSSNYIAFRLITNVCAFLICAVYTAFFSQRADLLFSTCLYLLFKADESFADVLFGIYQKHDRMDYIGRSQIARGIMSLFGFAFPLVAFGSLNLSIVVMCVGCMSVTVLYDLPRAKLFGDILPRISGVLALQLARTCFAAMLANLMIGSISAVVRQIFGVMQGDAALGVYAAIATPAVLVQAASNYLYSPLIGGLARANASGYGIFVRHFSKILIGLVVVIAALVCVLSLVGPYLLGVVYGQSISEDVYIFPYVLLATSSIGLVNYLFNVLILRRRFVGLFAMAAASLCVSLLIAMPLINMVGMNGVNFAIIFGCLAGVIIGLVSAFRK